MQWSRLRWLMIAAGLVSGCGSGLDILGVRHEADTAITPGADPKQDRAVVMGEGFNTAAQTFVGTCVKPNNVLKNIGIKDGTLTFDHSVDTQSVTESLGFSADVKAHYAMVKADASAKFSRAVSDDGYSEVFTFVQEFESGTDLFDEASGWANTETGNNAQGNWKSVCGDEFIHEITYGGRFYFVYRIDFMSRDDKQSFEAALHINVDTKIAAVDLSAKIDGAAKKFAKRASVHLFAYQYGGDPSQLGQIVSGTGTADGGNAAVDCDISNLDACKKMLTNAINYATGVNGFRSQLTQGTPVRILTKPWGNLGIQSGAPSLLSQEIVTDRGTLSNKFDKLMAGKVRIDRLVASGFALPPDVQSQMSDYSTKINAQIDQVNIAVGACFDQLQFDKDGNPTVETTTACTRAVNAVDVSVVPSDAVLSGTGKWLVEQKYKDLGGASGMLGAPSGDAVYAAPNGWRRDFANGSIFWSPDTDACALYGAILTKYNAMGANGGALGFPTTDVTPLSNPALQGQWARFRNGDIYWSANTNAVSVLQPLADQYAAQGGPAGWLGYPTSDTVMTRDNIGRKSEFQAGLMYWSPSGTYYLYGLILAEWKSQGSEGGNLGYPTANAAGAAEGGTQQNFLRGVILQHPQYGTFSITGGMYSKWSSVGGLDYLGYPLQDQWSYNGAIQEFAHGDLSARPGQAIFSIHGAVAQKWFTLGGALTDQRPITDTQGDGTGEWSHLADNSWVVASNATAGQWVDGSIFGDWSAFRNCIGYPVSDTKYNQDKNFWSIIQQAQTGAVGYSKGQRIVFRYSDGHRITDPSTCN